MTSQAAAAPDGAISPAGPAPPASPPREHAGVTAWGIVNTPVGRRKLPESGSFRRPTRLWTRFRDRSRPHSRLSWRSWMQPGEAVNRAGCSAGRGAQSCEAVNRAGRSVDLLANALVEQERAGAGEHAGVAGDRGALLCAE